jgi:hypothetical protein
VVASLGRTATGTLCTATGRGTGRGTGVAEELGPELGAGAGVGVCVGPVPVGAGRRTTSTLGGLKGGFRCVTLESVP